MDEPPLLRTVLVIGEQIDGPLVAQGQLLSPNAGDGPIVTDAAYVKQEELGADNVSRTAHADGVRRGYTFQAVAIAQPILQEIGREIRPRRRRRNEPESLDDRSSTRLSRSRRALPQRMAFEIGQPVYDPRDPSLPGVVTNSKRTDTGIDKFDVRFQDGDTFYGYTEAQLRPWLEAETAAEQHQQHPAMPVAAAAGEEEEEASAVVAAVVAAAAGEDEAVEDEEVAEEEEEVAEEEAEGGDEAVEEQEVAEEEEEEAAAEEAAAAEEVVVATARAAVWVAKKEAAPVALEQEREAEAEVGADAEAHAHAQAPVQADEEADATKEEVAAGMGAAVHDPIFSELIRHCCVANHSKATRDNNFATLMDKYLTWEALAAASVEDVELCVQGGGMGQVKADRIVRVMSNMREKGIFSLSELPMLGLNEARALLLRITGFKGKHPKTVEDTLNFALDRAKWASSRNSKNVPDEHDKWWGSMRMPACLAEHVQTV